MNIMYCLIKYADTTLDEDVHFLNLIWKVQYLISIIWLLGGYLHYLYTYNDLFKQ